MIVIMIIIALFQAGIFVAPKIGEVKFFVVPKIVRGETEQERAIAPPVAVLDLAPSALPPRFEAWFAARGWRPRRHQLEMVEAGRAERHALLIAPTGGGKTLGGFLPSLIDLAERPRPNLARPGVHTLYVSPLKALAVDVHRNLTIPAAEMGLPSGSRPAPATPRSPSASARRSPRPTSC